jgi:hypothetical protein
MRHRFHPRSLLLSLAMLCLAAGAASAQALDSPGISAVAAGHGKVRVTITAGASGAPGGFEVCYMPEALFNAAGGWPASGWLPGESWVDYTGMGSLNTWGSAQVDFRLSAGQSVDVEVGDTADETGVSGTTSDELTDATSYVICVFARASGTSTRSAYSVTVPAATSQQGSDCTYTIGYWKNHTSAWPVSSLTLGSVSYSASQLLAILNQPVAGNGLVSLAHQLIGAKLNIANGANPTGIASSISAADALIGGLVVPPVGAGSLAPSSTSALTQSLDDFNNGLVGPGHCGSTPASPSTWGRVKMLAR